jgi:protein LTV1
MAHPAVRVTVARPRDESKEDKKARKHAAKAEKQTRRVAKKVTQARFAAEFKQQRQALASQDDRRLHVL